MTAHPEPPHRDGPAKARARVVVRANVKPSVLTALLLTTLNGCGGYTTTVTDKLRLEPLPVYAEWWVATETWWTGMPWGVEAGWLAGWLLWTV